MHNRNCLLIAASTILLLSACHSQPAYEHKDDASSAPPAVSKPPVVSSDVSSSTPQSSVKSNGAIEFKNADGQKAFFLVHGPNSGNILGPEGNILLSFTDNLEGGKKIVRVQNGGSKFIAYISMPASDHLKIEDEKGKELYKLKMDDDHYKLKDSAGTTIYKLKVEPYGIKIEDGDTKNVLYKVKSKDGKIALKSEDGKEVFYSNATMPASVMACFGMDKLSREQQYALAYTLMYLRN